MSQTIRWPQYVAGLSASGGALVIGTGLGWSAPASSRLVDEDESFTISQEDFDWAASILPLGAAVSCLPIGFLMRKFGRKWTMMSLVVPFLIGWGLVAWAQNFWMLLIGRFMIGLAGGAFCVSAPQYSAEIAEKEIRGTIGSFFQLLVVTGVLFVYLIGPFMTVFWTSIVCGCLPLVFGAIFFFMPESPVYLIAENREKDAVKTLKWLRGSSYDPQNEIEEMKQELVDNEAAKVPLGKAFGKRSSILALIISFGLMFFQQMSGINVVIFFATFIFDAADTGIRADISTIIVGAVHVGATMASSVLVDKAGRKILLLVSIALMTLMLTALGVFFYIQDVDPTKASNIGWLPVTSLCVYIVAFALGFGPIPWIMSSEVYSKDISAISSPVAGAFNWTLAFLITKYFNTISNSIGIGQTFWIFTGLSLLGTAFVVFVVPETKGKSMAEIQRMLTGEKNFEKQNVEQNVEMK